MILETNTLVLDGSTNSVAMLATVRDVNGNPVEGIPVSFANATSYGTLATNDVLSGSDGIAANTLQNIVTPNPSVLEPIPITAYVINPDPLGDFITGDTQILQVGNQLAFNYTDINALYIEADENQALVDYELYTTGKIQPKLSLNDSNNITRQVEGLNKLVLNYCVPQIIGEAEGYIKYKNDVSTLAMPMQRPTSTYASNTLELKPWF